MPARHASPAVFSNGRILTPSVVMIEPDTKSQAETDPKRCSLPIAILGIDRGSWLVSREGATDQSAIILETTKNIIRN